MSTLLSPDDLSERQLCALLEGESDRIALLANATAFIALTVPGLNWCGVYLLNDSGDELVLGPFQGKPACTRIRVGKGVCGTAVARNETIVVPDVHDFPGHIACDDTSRSELVVPLRNQSGIVTGVLDLDSPRAGRFSAEDLETIQRVESFANILSKKIWS